MPGNNDIRRPVKLAVGVLGCLVLVPRHGLADPDAIYQCTNTDGRTYFQQGECPDGARAQQRMGADLDNKNDSVAKASSGSGSRSGQPRADIDPRIPENRIAFQEEFENGVQTWNPEVDVGWAQGKGVNGSSALVIEGLKPPDESYALDAKASSCVSVDAANTYYLAADVRLTAGVDTEVTNRVELTWYPSPDCSPGGDWGTYAEPKPEPGWQHVRSGEEEPMLNAQSAEIHIQQSGAGRKAETVYWDNIRLVRVNAEARRAESGSQNNPVNREAGTNVLNNPGFSENANDWKIYKRLGTRWVVSPGDRDPGSVRAVTESESGGDGERAIEQCVQIGDTQRFDAGISFRRDRESSAPGGGRFRISWYGEGGCSGPSDMFGSPEFQPDPGYGWQRLRAEDITAPKGVKSARVQVIAGVDSPGRHIGYWDNAFLITK